jgi:hypothetical protein
MRTTWSRLEKALDCGGNPIGLSENAMVDIMDITYYVTWLSYHHMGTIMHYISSQYVIKNGMISQYV